ncbi:MAG TPA: hypothetical protein VGD91_09810 [Trebonia sp.]
MIGLLLPAALAVFAYRKKAFKVREPGADEIGRWLASEFGLSRPEGKRVREAVRGGSDADLDRLVMNPRGTPVPAPRPAPASAAASLPEQLREPARALASRVLADGFRQDRLSRRLSWMQAGLGAAYLCFGVVVLVTGWGGTGRFLGAWYVVNAVVYGGAGYGAVVISRRRARARAERALHDLDHAPAAG